MKINKKLLVNLGCLLTGVYSGWIVTVIHRNNRECKLLKETNSQLELANNNVEEMHKLYMDKVRENESFREYVSVILTPEQKAKYFTED